jgi:ERCC4-type nuclease
LPAAQRELTLVIDSRENLPYSWQGVRSISKALPAGDYSVLGLEARVAIERKTLIDAYGTFGRGRDRFERELARLSQMDFAAVVIEASMLEALTRPPPKVQKFTPKHFNRAVCAWSQRFGVHFWFCDCRALAQRQTYILLERFWRDVLDGKR